MKYLAPLTALVLIAIFLVGGLRGKLYVPQPVAQTQTEQAVPDSWTFTAANGRKADVSMPVLQRFHYPGDVAFCAKAKELMATSIGTIKPIGPCQMQEALNPADRAQKLAEAATQLPLLTMTDDEGEADPIKEDSAALSLSALREAMETVPRNAPDLALSILEHYWAVTIVKSPERYYNPAFLFKDAFITEVAETRLALCRLTDDKECMTKMPPDAANALETVGRWKSDIGKLMLSIELAEADHARNKPDNPTLEIYYAQDLAGSYGYASEIAKGDEKLTYLRRGIAALEEVYGRYRDQVDAETRESLTGSLGTNYGRVAFISRQKLDVEKALEFDRQTAGQEKQLYGQESWETLSNLGDSHLLRGEVFGTEDDLRKGLELQQSALAKVEAENSDDGKRYVTMKLAESLVRYAEVDGTELSREKRVEMLNQGKQMATAMRPLFQETGTTIYENVVDNVVQRANFKLAALGEKSAEAEWTPASPPVKR